MKYMGSKRLMLMNGLGHLLVHHGARSSRLVDLFSGSAAVAWFAATNLNRPVFALDLQHYSRVLAESVIGRTQGVDAALVDEWLRRTLTTARRRRNWYPAVKLDSRGGDTARWVSAARRLCKKLPGGPIWTAYGGYYFSPSQAALLDASVKAIEGSVSVRAVCLSAVIMAASRCAAAPGHTAQPFQPTRSGARFISDAWTLEPLAYIRRAAFVIAGMHAQVKGRARVGDALREAANISVGDLVFVDPPYSAVQYSRFYHVLETIARGECGTVSGSGRYPPIEERPTSLFSMKTRAPQALETLLETLSATGARVILTIPAGDSSNGISGDLVIDVAEDLFRVSERVALGRFSTLGGNLESREARRPSEELVLVLESRHRH